MEWAIEKCTELGVARIVPIVAHRTDSHLAAAALKRRERWQRLALQASEQSRRARPPEIAAPAKLKSLSRAGSRIPRRTENNTRLRTRFRFPPVRSHFGHRPRRLDCRRAPAVPRHRMTSASSATPSSRRNRCDRCYCACAHALR
jgi:RsmE family RNA methyltransferase